MKNYLIIYFVIILFSISAHSALDQKSFEQKLNNFVQDYKKACFADTGYEGADENCPFTVDNLTPGEVLRAYADELPNEGLTYNEYSISGSSKPTVLSEIIEKSQYTDMGTYGKITRKLAPEIKSLILKAFKATGKASLISASENDSYMYDHFFITFDNGKTFTVITFGFSL